VLPLFWLISRRQGSPCKIDPSSSRLLLLGQQPKSASHDGEFGYGFVRALLPLFSSAPPLTRHKAWGGGGGGGGGDGDGTAAGLVHIRELVAGASGRSLHVNEAFNWDSPERHVAVPWPTREQELEGMLLCFRAHAMRSLLPPLPPPPPPPPATPVAPAAPGTPDTPGTGTTASCSPSDAAAGGCAAPAAAGAAAPLSNSPPAGSVLVSSRRGKRKVLNAEALRAALASELGAEAVHHEVLFFEDYANPQRATALVRLLRGARLLVAPHGAALTNMLFLPAGAQVVELLPYRCQRLRPYFATMARKLSLGYTSWQVGV
jgi:hypothetical protein